MLFKRKKKQKDTVELHEAERIEYISEDTELGRKYNDLLNKHYTEIVYSAALNYEAHCLLSKRIDRLEERVALLADERR